MGRRIVIVGGGAAGMFAAIRAAEADPGAHVTVLEKGRDLLQKVGISGGGRCNVTHDCMDPRRLVSFYPRGQRELRGMFSRFAAGDTVDWFAARGVRLKAEADGRMFPVTDRSDTVIDTLIDTARQAGVSMLTKRTVRDLRPDGPGFEVTLGDGDTVAADRVLMTTGGMRGGEARRLVEQLGHAVEEPVPSLFTFHIDDPRLRDLAGLSVPDARLRITGEKDLDARGPVLVTHWGLSGPGVLRLSAWGARALAGRDYAFEAVVDWLPDLKPDATAALLDDARRQWPRRHVIGTPLADLPRRLWERLCAAAAIGTDRTWAELRKDEGRALVGQLRETRFAVTGKSLNKDEFVTCGGVSLRDVDLRRMESRRVPGLFFAGEVLDIDGITGGFNLQAAWTGGWIAGEALGAPPA
jgi:predicted Rossmann fold flavoprotein